jgi:enamine deaminase RidA (YjgF/YER057c/UK114 family)
MILEKINPDSLPKPHGFAQAVVATGSKFVYTSGQVGADRDGNLVGGERDYRAQGRQAASNVYAALAAANAKPSDIVRLMMYVVDPSADNLDRLYEGLGEAAVEAGAKSTSMVLIGVTALSLPGAVVEFNATALID